MTVNCSGEDEKLVLAEGVLPGLSSILNEFVNTVLCTVAARSLVGHGLSCFYRELIFRGNKFSALYLFRRLVDGL